LEYFRWELQTFTSEGHIKKNRFLFGRRFFLGKDTTWKLAQGKVKFPKFYYSNSKIYKSYLSIVVDAELR
jgi:hypothetical protein